MALFIPQPAHTLPDCQQRLGGAKTNVGNPDQRRFHNSVGIFRIKIQSFPYCSGEGSCQLSSRGGSSTLSDKVAAESNGDPGWALTAWF